MIVNSLDIQRFLNNADSFPFSILCNFLEKTLPKDYLEGNDLFFERLVEIRYQKSKIRVSKNLFDSLDLDQKTIKFLTSEMNEFLKK